MIELKRLNVHRLVETKEKAFQLISEGFEVVKDELNILGNQVEKVVEEKKETVNQEIKEKVKK